MSNMMTAVKVPIAHDQMSNRKKQKLRQVVGRDSRIIKAFLGVIEEHEGELLTGKDRDRTDSHQLERLTMTAIKVKAGKEQRLWVPHDMKARFRRASVNEILECKDTAVAMYNTYLRLRKRTSGASRPCTVNSTRRVPRMAYTRCFKLIESDPSQWTLDLLNSLDSVPEGRSRHDRLRIPLKVSDYHEEQLGKGEVKSLCIFTDRQGKWWVSFSVKIDVPELVENGLPIAVLGIDLGIEKAVCTTLVTPEKVRETRYFRQEDKIRVIKRYDWRVRQLQREMHTRRNQGVSYDGVAEELRRIRHKRLNVSREYDRVLITQLLEYIQDMSKKYTLYVSIGRLKGIRATARKGNYRGRRFRGMIHSWTFARVTETLKSKLGLLGWPIKGMQRRFRAVPEQWTSIICWRCGNKGRRPTQNHFHCTTCGLHTNADKNGAINIAHRFIKLTSFNDVGGLGLFATTFRSRRRPKARRKSSSKERSLPSGKELHRAQRVRGQGNRLCSRTVETLTVVRSDDLKHKQEKEARTVGGGVQ